MLLLKAAGTGEEITRQQWSELRRKSKAVPRKELVPVFVMALMTPPGGETVFMEKLLVRTVNS